MDLFEAALEDQPDDRLLSFFVKNDCSNMRLDLFLAAQNPDWTRSFVSMQIEAARVLQNGKIAKKAGQKVRENDEIVIECPPAQITDLIAEDIPLKIVYQDADIAVIDKAQGMVVHPAPGHDHGTLVNALLFHLNDLAGIGGELRPGIVHRIDKDTTGLLVVAKNDHAHRDLCRQIREKSAKRKYWAIVENNIKQDSGFVDAAIARSKRDRKKMAVCDDGRSAVTHYQVLQRFGSHTWLECSLETGRTHQIRVHMTHIGHPIAGDAVYGSGRNSLKIDGGQALHAYQLEITHPSTGKRMRFFADAHENFSRALKKLEAIYPPEDTDFGNFDGF